MTYPRAHLVDSETPCFYHLVSRCVRRAWLCGEDPETGRSFEHRRAWVEKRLLYLAQFFSVDVYAYAVMSNHYHIVLYFDPLAPVSWTDADVARRWLTMHPRRQHGERTEVNLQEQIDLLLKDPQQVQVYRSRLGSLSWYMRTLNHPLACWANREDACTGHFWEGRFRSAVLLDESAVLACMAYVDLNPVRARIAQRLEDCRHTSIRHRLEEWRDEAPLSALCPGLGKVAPCLPLTLYEYRALLLSAGFGQGPVPTHPSAWSDRVASMRRVQRAHGLRNSLLDWVQCVGQRWSKAWALPNN